ncbi:MAG TPA: hypothetical protein IAA61_06280 [Candidatus Ornithomonoglobus merdipullorum]|uniref:Uncharacterized protein n=1 Tax=Candidatus Ornithomonoglobus merdipullorum TaxID=2840895 RepID=A0A9D1MBF7_9FIRM|nr:hypothetical protein [Candidatus Ornithomonoglobus merdipullorum]
MNNTDSETDSVFVMAAYDADSGELLKLMPSEQALPQNENVVNMTFDCGGLPEGFVFKLFMWDSMENMIPLDSAFEKTIVR